jgi:hypothetical protein
MNFELRTLIVALASFAGTGLIVGAIVPWLSWRTVPSAAETRARRLARLRLWPAASGVVTGLAAIAAFLVFESRLPRESVSDLVIGFALIGSLLFVASAWRLCRLLLATRRTARGWFESAEPIAFDGVDIPARSVDVSFPIVAVIGLFRPTLVVARSVLAKCTAEELRAVVAHERSHIGRRDNLRRLAMMAAPDVLSWLPVSARLFDRWNEATEEAADDEAGKAQADGRLHLASALVKVARLAEHAPAPLNVPASALYSGGSLESRVRRLLDGPARPVAPHVDAIKMLAVFSIAIAVIIAAAQLPGVHDWLETIVHTLP